MCIGDDDGSLERLADDGPNVGGACLCQDVRRFDPRQLDDLGDQCRQTSSFPSQAVGELVHLNRVVKRTFHRLTEKRDSADGGFDFVCDVGDEIPPNRLEVAFFGVVFDEDQDISATNRNRASLKESDFAALSQRKIEVDFVG